MELLNGFYELAEDMVYIFDWIYANVFSVTLGDTISNWISELPEDVIDFIVNLLDFYGFADSTWISFLFGTGLVFVVIWKLIGFITHVLP